MGLTLTRKLNQRIFIGKGITIEVVEIRRHHVRLRIEAPKDVPILRSNRTAYRLDTGELRTCTHGAIHNLCGECNSRCVHGLAGVSCLLCATEAYAMPPDSEVKE